MKERGKIVISDSPFYGDLQVPKQMESIDVKGETKEEEGYHQAVQMTTAVIEASNQASNMIRSNFSNYPCYSSLLS